MTTLLLATALSATPPALGPLVVQPRLIREVQYLGADHLSTRNLCELTGIRAGDRMSPKRNELGRQSILHRYRDEGRFFASVALVEGASPLDARVVYRVVEGPVVKVAEVQFRGNKAAGADTLLAAKGESGVAAGATFRPSALDEDVRALSRYYRGLGQAGTEIVPEVVPTAEVSRVVVVFHIVETRK